MLRLAQISESNAEPVAVPEGFDHRIRLMMQIDDHILKPDPIANFFTKP